MADLRLSEREHEVLAALVLDGDVRTRLGRWGWSRPLDVGGHSRSHHSATLTRLVNRGLVERRQRGAVPRARGSWIYRSTQAGREALKLAGSVPLR